MDDAAKRLAPLRREINQIDDELLALLNKRAAIAKKVADVKGRDGSSFYVPSREREIVDRLQKENPGPFPTEAVRPVFQEVISACLSLEQGLRVSYLGPETTFTHQALRRHFGTSAQSLPCGSIAAVFAEVSSGQTEFGVVPVENSTEGIVNHTLDSFVDSSLTICAEIVVDIEHNLLARERTDLGTISKVYSHGQALAQCRTWLEDNLNSPTLVTTSSTAEAARLALVESGSAAIASQAAARRYGLATLRQGVQDVSDNVTRFLVVGKQPPKIDIAEDPNRIRTSILLALPDKSGWLFKVLEPLSKAQVNLTKIESRPSRQRKWDYVFFLDVDGHRDAEPLSTALTEVEASADMLRVLGTYRKADVN